MTGSGGGWLFWALGAVVMLLLLVGAVTVFTVVLSVWLHLFAGRPLDGPSVAVRMAVAVGTLALVAGLMEWRSRL